jgi:hypothetical protein
MSNNSNSNDNGINQTTNKKMVPTPTIGEAIKEALDTGKEVIVEGPAEADDITDIKNSISQINELEKDDEYVGKGIAKSKDMPNNSKMELNVKDKSAETSFIEDKIILDKDKDNAEATVATVTTIPADDGIEVEVQTEVEVPVEDKDKDIDSDLKVLVHSPSLSTEVPLIPTSRPSALSIQKERISQNFDAQVNQQLYDKSSMNGYSETIKGLQKQIIQITRDMTESYMDLQKQTIYSFQSTLDTILQNTNNIFKNNQAYCSKIPQIYSKMAITCTENTIAMSKMVNDIAFANASTIKKLYNNFQKH